MHKRKNLQNHAQTLTNTQTYIDTLEQNSLISIFGRYGDIGITGLGIWCSSSCNTANQCYHIQIHKNPKN